MIGEKRELFRIQALVDIPAHGVKAGDLGGYVERERCLSRRGDSWAGGRAEGTAKLDGASLLMHNRISIGTVTGEQPVNPADRKDMDTRMKTDPVCSRIRKGLVGSL